jgi:GNAT superfamily N-acetyltransferase
MVETAYRLRAPETEADWSAYHAIRRRVLFENRGLVGVYDAQHPDEFRENHYPLILEHGDKIMGVIRVDVDSGTAIFRRVAIREDQQRCGHGRIMLSLAEAFARSRKCDLIRSFVNPGAVGFYERCGFSHDASTEGDLNHVPMWKSLG